MKKILTVLMLALVAAGVVGCSADKNKYTLSPSSVTVQTNGTAVHIKVKPQLNDLVTWGADAGEFIMLSQLVANGLQAEGLSSVLGLNSIPLANNNITSVTAGTYTFQLYALDGTILSNKVKVTVK